MNAINFLLPHFHMKKSVSNIDSCVAFASSFKRIVCFDQIAYNFALVMDLWLTTNRLRLDYAEVRI